MQRLPKAALAVLATTVTAGPATAQIAFASDALPPVERLSRIDLKTFEITVIGQLAGPNRLFSGIAFGPDGRLYGYAMNAQQGSNLGLHVIDIVTGDATFLGGAGIADGDFVLDLELNPVDQKIYGVGFSVDDKIRLYTFDLATGTATVVQEIPDTTPCFAVAIGLAIDPTGRIFVFNHLCEDRMYEIVGGALQPLPQEVPFDASFSQGMTFDQNDGTWYLAGVDWQANDAVFYEIDPATGSGSLLHTISGRQFGDIAILDYRQFPIGQGYCQANLNSTGLPGTIGAFGFDVANENLVRLIAAQLPADEFGYFLNSPTQGFVQNPGGSQGNLCLGGQIGRHVADVASSGASGELILDLDLEALPGPNGRTAVMAGQTWNFQAWFRDNDPGPTSNFTDGVSVLFL